MRPSPLSHAASTPDAAAEVLRFWFGPADVDRPEWFHKSAAFDAEIDLCFGMEVEAALHGRLDAWRRTLDGSLALVILLDQFTRNIHRGAPQAFAGDAQALAIARELVEQGRDTRLPLRRRSFLYLPFEHAEDRAAQEESVRLYTALAAEGAGPQSEALARTLDYAVRHRDIVARFGRFPHRNEVLGRASTAEEIEFLKQPGSRF
ncbi:DUF924 family protein [Methylibium petroleiphilum]|uniref:DUF924 family protein n=1 Tax=Methylibium petroleiphilum TaxID=105560 RepID=UPI003D2A2080